MKIYIAKLCIYIGINRQNYCPNGVHNKSNFRHTVLALWIWITAIGRKGWKFLLLALFLNQ